MHIVQPNQSAFRKGHAIHDNFMAVQSTAKLLHAWRCATILLKVDIVKDFDTISWAFLLELLSYIGCSRRWVNWGLGLLPSASTQILLNGWSGRRICHAQGLRQGNPLSPLLFILAMEALNGMFLVASDRNLFTPLRIPSLRYRISLYADDVVIFIVPSEQDICLVRVILECFTAA
jgi:hypothetical protein